MEIDSEQVIDGLGGEVAVARMSHEARADALEEYLSDRLDGEIAARRRTAPYPSVADYEDRIETRPYRRGVGRLFVPEHDIRLLDEDMCGRTVPHLKPMPTAPTLIDYFKLRFEPAAHLLQSARLARK